MHIVNIQTHGFWFIAADNNHVFFVCVSERGKWRNSGTFEVRARIYFFQTQASWRWAITGASTPPQWLQVELCHATRELGKPRSIAQNRRKVKMGKGKEKKKKYRANRQEPKNK